MTKQFCTVSKHIFLVFHKKTAKQGYLKLPFCGTAGVCPHIGGDRLVKRFLGKFEHDFLLLIVTSSSALFEHTTHLHDQMIPRPVLFPLTKFSSAGSAEGEQFHANAS